MKLWKFDHIHEIKFISFLLILFLILQMISGYIELFVPLPSNWQIPIIFGALLVIARMLPTIYKVDNNVEELIKKIGLGEVKRYDTYGEFYKDLDKAVSQANISLDLSHIRDETPDHFILGGIYFDKIEKWCSDNPGCPVRRIIAINNNEMLQWAKELLEINRRCNNFYVRVCDWNANFPMINMAIIDGTKVFLAITADIPERTAGIQIKDPAITRYFSEFYNNVWGKSKEFDYRFYKRNLNS